jgi:hypothetical protein
LEQVHTVAAQFVVLRATGYPYNVFDTRNGYFDANPLGFWTAVFIISYTAAGLDPNNAVCKQVLDVLRAKNGTDLDGTPQIHQAIEVDDLEKKGAL